MISLLARLYLALQDQINLKVPEIRFIDIDLGQLEYYETEPAVSWPCVLIDFPGAQFSNEGENVQWCDFNVQIRLGFAPFSSANSLAPTIAKEAGLKYFEVEHKLYGALQGFTAGDIIQPMTRLTSSTERREDPFRVRELTFSTAAEDDSAMIPVHKIITGLHLEGEISSNDTEWEVYP